MSTPSRTRLDTLLVERGITDSAGRAAALIAAGLIEVDGVRGASAAQPVAARAQLRVIGRTHQWASRGGLKLEAALRHFAVAVDDRVCLDAGASHGGFTDVLLSLGARLVYAVDVGHGQLVARLATDPRVVVMDRTNIRTLTALDGAVPDLITLDLSFISLRAVLPALTALAPAAEVVALFKPQFEVLRGDVGAGGVVRDPATVSRALADFAAWAGTGLGARSVSPPVAASVRGAKGNQEWLVHLRLGGART